MSEKERSALSALDDLIDYKAKHWGSDHEEAAHWLTIKEMLARPILPEEPSEDAIREMQRAFREHLTVTGSMEAAYRALYAHLTAPRTKEVELEKWAVANGTTIVWCRDEGDARSQQRRLGRAQWSIARLTGKATVSA